jgi:arylsulfatase A-like enzyme
MSLRSAGVALIAMTVLAPACRRAQPSGTVRLVAAFRPETISGAVAPSTAPAALLQWRFDGPAGDVPEKLRATHGWEVAAAVDSLAIREGRLAGRSTAALPLLHFARTTGLDPDLLHSIEVRLRVSAGTRLSVRFSEEEKPDLTQVKQGLQDYPEQSGTPIVAGPEMRTYTFRRPDTVTSSEMRHVYLQPTNTAGASFEIESVRFVLRREHIASIASGVSWQGLSGIFQETLVARSPEVLRFDLALPARPWLDLAVGTIEDAPVTFRAAVLRQGGSEQVLLEQTVTTPHRWEDVPLDLSAFAGEKVSLSLAIVGERPGTLGFWGAPVIRSRGAAPAPQIASEAPGEPPQGVILVWADTLRRDHLDAYGYERETAPVLRRMAAEGARFENCLTQATWTKVSTPSMLTSLYPSSHTVTTWDDRLPSTAVTLAEVYRDAGYATFSYASNGFTGQLTNLHKGFEQVHEDLSLPDRKTSKTARVGMDRLFAWLEMRKDAPFFAFLSVLDPHDPYKPRPPYDTLFADAQREKEHERQTEAVRKLITIPFLKRFGMPSREELVSAGVDPEAWVSYNRDLYDGSIRGLDAELGRLFERLRALGLEKKTLVVFTGDHGEEFLEHGRTFHGQSTYGELNAVPLVIWRPGSIPTGVVVPEVVETIDLMPTLLALAGLRGPSAMQGRSLVPLLAQPAGSASASGTVRAASGAWQPRPAITEQIRARDDRAPLDIDSVAIVTDGWKLIHNTKRYPPRPEFELFDFHKDPLDSRNVASDHPEIVERLSRELAAWRKKADAERLKPDAEATKAMSGEELERLRALGYVQ